MMRQVSSPVRRGAGRKGRKDLARSLPGFDAPRGGFLNRLPKASWPSKKVCVMQKFGIFEFANSIRPFCRPPVRENPSKQIFSTKTDEKNRVFNTYKSKCHRGLAPLVGRRETPR